MERQTQLIIILLQMAAVTPMVMTANFIIFFFKHLMLSLFIHVKNEIVCFNINLNFSTLSPVIYRHEARALCILQLLYFFSLRFPHIFIPHYLCQ